MSPVVDMETALSDLPAAIFKTLAAKLEENRGWIEVGKYSQALDHDQLSALSTAEALLLELGNKLWKVKHLQFILRYCHLYDALAVISEREPLVVCTYLSESLRGKETLKIRKGDEMSLKFVVQGLPPPKYFWFRDKEVIQGQHDCLLHFTSFSESLQGMYSCDAVQYLEGQQVQRISSDSIVVEVQPEKPEILEMLPTQLVVPEGSSVKLELKVKGYPTPKFLWIHENEVLKEHKNILYIPKLLKSQGGLYKCSISNKAGEIFAESNIIVETKSKIFTGAVTAKVALLIANEKYNNLEDLYTPENDVVVVAEILKSLGFVTLCFCNLNVTEMQAAIKLFSEVVKKGAYAFFYFAGHGFKCNNIYLLPVDSPESTKFEVKDAISETQLLTDVLEKDPVLYVVLLDMCLKQPECNEILERIPPCYKPNRNLLRGYSTTTHRAAYERENQANGVYVNILKNYLKEKMTIREILQKVSEDMENECPDQMPEFKARMDHDFYLDNPVEGQFEHGFLADNAERFFLLKTVLNKYMNP